MAKCCRRKFSSNFGELVTTDDDGENHLATRVFPTASGVAGRPVVVILKFFKNDKIAVFVHFRRFLLIGEAVAASHR